MSMDPAFPVSVAKEGWKVRMQEENFGSEEAWKVSLLEIGTGVKGIFKHDFLEIRKPEQI